MKIRIGTALLVTILLITACAPNAGGDAAMNTVSGTVTYREKIALPPDAVVIVQIQDISLADAPATVIGEQIIQTDGAQVPFAFEIPYDPAEIEARRTYSLAARIEDGSGNLLFINDTVTPVINKDNPTKDIEVVLIIVAESPDTGTIGIEPFMDVIWRWKQTLLPDDTLMAPDDPDRYTVEFTADGVFIKADCNNILGSYIYAPDGNVTNFELGPTTLVACPADSLDTEFTDQLTRVEEFFIQEGNLRMTLLADGGLMLFTP